MCYLLCALVNTSGVLTFVMGNRMWDFLQKSMAAHEHSAAPVWNSVGIDNFMFGETIIQSNMIGIKKFPVKLHLWH